MLTPKRSECKEASSAVSTEPLLTSYFLHHQHQHLADPLSFPFFHRQTPTKPFLLLHSFTLLLRSCNCNHGTINRRSLEPLAPRPRLRQHCPIRHRTQPGCTNSTIATTLPGPTTPFARPSRRNRYCFPRERRAAGSVRRQHHHWYPATELRRTDRYGQLGHVGSFCRCLLADYTTR